MNLPVFKRIQTKRILFVWDGTKDHLLHAEQYIDAQSNGTVFAVHAMPHESIYSYGTVRHDPEVAEYAERRLKRKFATLVKNFVGLQDAELELLFGDPVSSIVRFAQSMKIETILLPRLSQSKISRFLRGDLNEKIVETAPCHVVFLDSAGNALPARLT